jgi:hypothetical protein
MLCILGVLAFLYSGIPGGEVLSRVLFPVTFVALVLLVVAAVVVAALVAVGVIKPRDRRRR